MARPLSPVCESTLLAPDVCPGYLSRVREDLLRRISLDPAVCFGKPCIRGHRIWVSLILDMLTDGLSIEDLLKEYPQLERDDILACLAYGAEMSRERCVPIPAGSAA